MVNKSIKKRGNKLYGFSIDLSVLFNAFRGNIPHETIDIEHEDLTNQKLLNKPMSGKKTKHRKNKNGGVVFRLLSLIGLF